MILAAELPSDLTFDLNLVQEKFVEMIKREQPDLFQVSKMNEVQINFVTDPEIQELNKLHRGKDAPTDVLSWGFIDENLLPHEIAGEIYISMPTAKKYAKSKNISLDHEVVFLIVHGLLHVFNYDHNTDDEEAEMDRLTDEVIRNLDYV
jgi:probable rRNA maturation factor